ncbi:MAG TPA: thioredoxin domain-containing protein [Roseiflexaceae bacterium]|nr:thioredoxin domain-containing protein [Roseiflexaceae bacterium]
MVRHTNPDGTPTYTNRLVHATSPYLLQHAHNPVDWYEWGEEAFTKSRAEDKPILLSVGYAACHWCHRLAEESFEDEKTAALMNKLFVNIKVDREERPDIDNIYMMATQAMTGGGGWPMTVFMSQDGTPFYAGTYFPPEDRYGMPSFRRVLLAVADAYANRRAELLEAGQELVARMREAAQARLPAGSVGPSTLDAAYAALERQFDPAHGGFGRAPKFPQPTTLEFLLRYSARTGEQRGMEMLAKTLRRMAEGGMYDQLGGGFHRYSVDERWLVPHFEKMLYDNALLARVYVEAHQATGEPFYRRIAEEVLDYMLREMRHPGGGFFSTQDADSLPPEARHHTGHGDAHKEEGAFFVWRLEEVRAALGEDATVFAELYDVTEAGNFEGQNILHVARSPAEVAHATGLPLEHVEAIAARGRRALFERRERRPKPARDDKVLTAWNGMAIRALAQAATALGREDYRDAARECASFVLRTLRRKDGVLLRSWRETREDRGRGGSDEDTAGNSTPSTQPSHRVPAFLEDYALLADGLLALYEATFEPRWLLEARALAETMLAEFWDDGIQGFYDTAASHEQLVVRPRDTGDNATPCGNSAAADVLLRLAVIFDEPRYRERALAVLGGMAPFMERYPTGFGRYLAAAEFALFPVKEVALVGETGAADTRALAEAVWRPFIPGKVLLHRPPQGAPPIDSPLLADRAAIGGRATAYVCQNYTCRLPVTDPASLRAQLGVG